MKLYASAALIPGLLLASSLQAETVTIYSWENYLAQEVISAFNQETGHTVEVSEFSDETHRDSLISSGRGNAFDLIVIESLGLQSFAAQGLFHDLSPQLAPVAAQYDPRWLEACGPHGMPYAWGTTGLLYRESVTREPIHSWLQLFNPPKEHWGQVAMYFDQLDTTGVALLAAGYAPFSEDTDELKAAFKLLQQQAPALLSQEYGVVHAMATGQANNMSLMLGFAGDTAILADETGQSDWRYVVPDEGSLLWTECLAAPSGRPLGEATRAFIEFINRPDIAALNAEQVWFATPSRAALALTSDEYQQESDLFPAEDVLQRSHSYQLLSGEALRLRSRMLNALR